MQHPHETTANNCTLALAATDAPRCCNNIIVSWSLVLFVSVLWHAHAGARPLSFPSEISLLCFARIRPLPRQSPARACHTRDLLNVATASVACCSRAATTLRRRTSGLAIDEYGQALRWPSHRARHTCAICCSPSWRRQPSSLPMGSFRTARHELDCSILFCSLHDDTNGEASRWSTGCCRSAKISDAVSPRCAGSDDNCCALFACTCHIDDRNNGCGRARWAAEHSRCPRQAMEWSAVGTRGLC